MAFGCRGDGAEGVGMRISAIDLVTGGTVCCRLWIACGGICAVLVCALREDYLFVFYKREVHGVSRTNRKMHFKQLVP